MPQPTDRQTFTRLLEAAEPELLRYLMTLLPHPDDAADALQNASIALWERFDDYERDKPFLPWAYRFAYLHALKHRARAGRRIRMLSADVLEKLAERRIENSDVLDARREALADCVAKLPDADQDLIQHRYAQKATVQQLAADSGRNVHTLYKTLERIRKNLFECVNESLQAEGYE